MAERTSLPFEGRLAYLLGGLLIFVGLLATLNHYSGFAVLASGVFLLPSTRRYVQNRLGYRLSGSATLVIAIILLSFPVIATYSVDEGSSGDFGGGNFSQTEDTVSKSNYLSGPPEHHLPSIEDFESGWRQIGDEDTPNNTSQFFNMNTESFIEFKISYYSSRENARVALRDQRNVITDKGIATTTIDIGNEGFIYSRSSEYHVVRFRVLNVVCQVNYQAGSAVLTPETNAKDFARLFEDKIR